MIYDVIFSSFCLKTAKKLFFDRRDGSEIDMVSVNETANEPPNEDNVGINDPRNLTLEATYVNKVFCQQCLKQGEWNDLKHKNPYIDPSMPKDRVASAGYRYRLFKLGDYKLVARTAVDAVTVDKKTNKKSYALIRALNEWDPKVTFINFRIIFKICYRYLEIGERSWKVSVVPFWRLRLRITIVNWPDGRRRR